MAQLHYSDMEARRQLADVDHGEDVNIQGEGYGVFSDDQKKSFNSPPTRSSEAPLQVQHQRNDAISGKDLISPLVVPSGYGTLPVTSGYGNLDLKQEEAGKALPAASPNEGHFDRSGVAKEESMAKELQDQSATGGGIIDVHSLKDDYVDLSEDNTNQKSSADDQSAVGEGIIDVHSLKDSYVDFSEENKNRESSGGEGIIDVYSLKDRCVDLSEGYTNQPSGANEPTDEAAKAREATAQLTSEIKSPLDDPKQEQTSQIHAPVAEQEREATAQLTSEIKSPLDDPKQEQTAQIHAPVAEQEQAAPPAADEKKQEGSQPCNESHGCQSFEGDDGREKINVEGFNIYSGEPENVVYDAADVKSGQPESALNVKDDDMWDTQEVLGDIKQEEKPLPNEEVDGYYSREAAPENLPLPDEDVDEPHSREAPQDHLQEGKPENGVNEDVYVMAGQPGSVMDVDDHGVRDMLAVLGDAGQEQKPLPNEEIADVRELLTEGGAGTAVEQKPLPNEENVDVRELQTEEGADISWMHEGKVSIADEKSGDQPGLQEGKPENGVYDAAYVMGGQPGSVVDIIDDGVRDSQAVLGDAEQEQEPFPKEANVDVRELQTEEGPDNGGECDDKASIDDVKSKDQTGLQESKPENSLYEAAHVMGSQPGSAVDVRDSQAVFGDTEQEQEPLPKEANLDVRELQTEEGPDNAGEREDKASIDDVRSKDQTGLQEREDKASIDDVRSKDQTGLQERKPENSLFEAAYVLGGQPGSVVDVRDSQAVLGDTEQEQEPLPKESTVDLRELQAEDGPQAVLGDTDQEQKPLPKEANVDLRELQAEEGPDNTGECDDKGFIDDVKSEDQTGMQEGKPENNLYEAAYVMGSQPGSVVDVSNPQAVFDDVEQEQKSLPNEANVDLRELQTEEGIDNAGVLEDKPENALYDAADLMGSQPGRKVDINEGNVDARELQTEEGADTAGEREEVFSITDSKNDQLGLQEGKPENGIFDAAYVMGTQPRSVVDVNDDVRDLQAVLGDVEQEQKPPSNKADVNVYELQTEEEADMAVEREDKATIADVKSDDQSGMGQVRNPDQPQVDDNVDAQGALLLVDLPEVPKQPRSGEESKESEQGQAKRAIADFDENQKDKAQTGEQFILNAPVVDYNSMNLPVQQAAELKVNSQERDSSLKNAEGESGKSPYTEFDDGHDYVKVGYGAEGFVPKNNEEIDRELREPVDQEKERRQTDEHPLDKSLQLDAYGATDGKSPSGKLDGDSSGKNAEGIYIKPADYEYERPPTRPHPQPEDLAGIFNNNNNNNNNDNNSTAKDVHPDDGQYPDGAPHKKGVFERIKEKLAPHHESK